MPGRNPTQNFMSDAYKAQRNLHNLLRIINTTQYLIIF